MTHIPQLRRIFSWPGLGRVLGCPAGTQSLALRGRLAVPVARGVDAPAGVLARGQLTSPVWGWGSRPGVQGPMEPQACVRDPTQRWSGAQVPGQEVQAVPEKSRGTETFRKVVRDSGHHMSIYCWLRSSLVSMLQSRFLVHAMVFE